MATIYLDHNIVHYFAIGFRSKEEQQRETRALREASDLGYQIALSDWSIVETANEATNAKVDACLQFIESLSVRWMFNARYVQRLEVRRFLNVGEVYPDTRPALTALSTAHFNQLAFLETPTLPIQTERTTPHDLLSQWRAKPYLLEGIRDSARETPVVIGRGQRAKADGKIKQVASLIDEECYAQLLPTQDNRGAPPTADVRNGWLRECMAGRERLKRMAPTIMVEDALTKERIADPMRRATVQDAYDLQHALVPLVYCDALVTADKYLQAICGKAGVTTEPVAHVVESLSRALDILSKPAI